MCVCDCARAFVASRLLHLCVRECESERAALFVCVCVCICVSVCVDFIFVGEIDFDESRANRVNSLISDGY